jgi:hypothetical protein
VGLGALNLVLGYFDEQADHAGRLLDTDPRAAAMVLMMSLEVLYEHLAPDPKKTDSPLPAAGRVLLLLNIAFRDLECGKPSELFKPVNTGGASRLSYYEDERRLWAAVALEARARETGETPTAAGNEIGKKLGIPRGQRHIVVQWRKDIVSGKRGSYWKGEFDAAVAGIIPEDWAIKWAKEAAEKI